MEREGCRALRLSAAVRDAGIHRLKNLPQKQLLVALALILGIVLPLFLQLGNRGLNEPDEGRYSEMGREMMASGDWLVPRLEGVPHYAKPPWIYWSIAASLKLFGVNETAARLPSALAAIAAALTVFALGRRMGGTLAGVLAALALSSSLLFFSIARLITPDMTLTAGVTFAMYCFWRWRTAVTDNGARRWMFGFFVTLGLAFLDKGPVALAVCALTVGGFFLMMRQPRGFLKMGWLRGVLIVLAIALPWFLLMARLNPDLYNFYLGGEIRDRVLSGRGRTKVWYYFFIILPLACWPWTALAWSAARAHGRRWRAGGEASALLLAWVFFPFLLFTLSQSKLPTYILPLMPPIGLMLGLWLADQLRTAEGKFPYWSATATWILIPAFGALPWVLTSRTQPQLTPVWIGLLSGLLMFSVVASGLLRRIPSPRGRTAGQLATWWLMTVLLLQGFAFFMRGFETELRHNSSWRSLVQHLDGLNPVGVPLRPDLHPNGQLPVFAARPGVRVATYEFECRGAGFYLFGKRAEVIPNFSGNSLWEIGRDRDAEKRPGRKELVALLRAPEPLCVFTRPQYLEDLRQVTGMALPELASGGRGEYRIVLFSNQPGK